MMLTQFDSGNPPSNYGFLPSLCSQVKEQLPKAGLYLFDICLTYSGPRLLKERGNCEFFSLSD